MTRLPLSSPFIFLLGLALASLSPLRAADPLTEQECHKFGQQFAKLCREGDSTDQKGLRDDDALFDNTLKGLELDEAQRMKSREDYDELYQNLWPQTLKLDRQRTFYYSGTITHDNRQCVVINWATSIICDLYLVAVARSAEGKLKYTDIYNVSNATWESELRRNQVLMRLPKEVLMRQPADALRYLRVTSALKKITESPATGKQEDTEKREEILGQIEKYSEKSRAQKPVLRLAVILYASVFKKDEFKATIERWKKLYPEDLSANFHAYRGYLQFGDKEAAIIELQALKNKAGNNPYLQFILSDHYHELGNLREAKKAAVMAMREGTHSDPIIHHWVMLLKISSKEKDYQETVRLLGNNTKNIPRIREILDTDPDFQEFRQSNEYRQWIAGAQPTHH